ncbi:MAG TPA: hypothetical protein DGT23_22450 [Micromonosporaceae bacterium]|nr:hypothetical protein [Micromonosporaceae bacterium]
MTVSIAGVTSPRKNMAYITGDMFKAQGRAGVQVNNLVPKGNEAQQDAALLQKIKAGSSWCDLQIGPAVMAATADTVQETVNVNRRGWVEIFPRFRPVIGLTAFAIGPDASNLTTFTDLTGVDIQEGSFKVPAYANGLWSSSEGPIQFGRMIAPWDQALARYTVVSGFPVTTLTTAVAANATSIPVADTTGIVAGKTWLTIYALQDQYSFLATSVSTADAGGLGTGPGNIGCAAVPSAIEMSDIQYPPLVSALPSALNEAVALATRGIIKESGGSTGKGPSAGDDFATAEAILRKFFILDA